MGRSGSSTGPEAIRLGIRRSLSTSVIAPASTVYLGREFLSFLKDLLAAANFLGARILPFNLLRFSSIVSVASC